MPEQSDYRVGQGVWHPAHANGVITGIYWQEQYAHVQFYNKKNIEIYSFDELYGNWDWKLKQWVLTA